MKKILPLLILGMMGCTNKVELRKSDECSFNIFTKSINNPKATIEGDTLTISSGARSDFFNDPNGDKFATAPLLIKELDNTKPFTFIAKVKPSFANTYDAGTVYLFVNDNLWQKFAFEMDERGLTRLVTVRTISTSDDNNHDAITSPDIYMKVSSDTKTVGFYYSLDGEQWQLVRLYRNDYPSEIYLALSSQSPLGEGIDTKFTNIMLSENAIKDFRLGL